MSFQIIKGRNGDDWNHGLGCKQREVKETLKRIQAETGRTFEEVGNESANVKRKAGTYVITEREMREMHQELQVGLDRADG